eukprot:gene19481-biopygen11531
MTQQQRPFVVHRDLDRSRLVPGPPPAAGANGTGRGPVADRTRAWPFLPLCQLQEGGTAASSMGPVPVRNPWGLWEPTDPSPRPDPLKPPPPPGRVVHEGRGAYVGTAPGNRKQVPLICWIPLQTGTSTHIPVVFCPDFADFGVGSIREICEIPCRVPIGQIHGVYPEYPIYPEFTEVPKHPESPEYPGL